ncbi:MAG: L,D-transpeptidase family protein [Deltaproteobacteria bacterium]|nr:L,D-transpeptidase family protein [Deltaproteobacteria bacterium]
MIAPANFKYFLEKRLNTKNEDVNSSAHSPSLYYHSAISSFYGKNDFKPLWTLDTGLTPQAEQLVRSIEAAELDGLISEDYHVSQIKALIADFKEALLQKQSLDSQKQADLDLLLTDAFLLFSSHLLTGRVFPGSVDSTWLFFNPPIDLATILNSDAYSSRIESFFDELRPAHAAYYRLRNALQHYIGIQKKGGWSSIRPGPSLRIGDTDDRVDKIRKRLIVTKDIDSPARNVKPAEFDESLMKGVQRFQNRHGIEPDGVVGQSTLTAMNVPVEDRIRQIELNLERWRWIPHDLGSRYILVNIADYSLAVVENQTTVLDMRVVVGRSYRRTPVFSEKIKYLVLNPFWNVPIKIAVEDKLPIIRKNPLYLTQQHIRVFESWGEDAPEINPAIINWYGVNANYFPYRLRQDPGPLNALGRIKFMFPNKFSVYLHDTPQRSLFKRASRDFSSGCIRIEKPVELAKYLLQTDPQWPNQKIMETIESGVTTVVRIKDPIPVHLLYWTAWVTETGTVHFGNDIYDRDPPLSRALKAKLKDTFIPAMNLPDLRAEN